MKYNDTTNKNGIIQQVERYINMGATWISGDTDRLREFTAYANKVGHKIWHWIFLSQGVWKYDDANHTDLPQATTNLVDAQATYALPSDALTIERVEVKNSNGDWFRLRQIIENQIPGAIEEFNETDNEPVYYRLIGNTIELFPASNYDSTNGLKVYFDRDSVDFTYDDTTQTPGFASPYHEAVPVGMAIEWLKIKNPTSTTLQFLREEWAKFEVEIKKFYSLRNKDNIRVLRRAFQSYK
jgi:hypothetical protein